MLRYKHLRLDQEKISRVKEILGAKTETEALDRAMDMVLQAEQDNLYKEKVMRRILELRNSLGKIEEDTAEWVRLARQERNLTHDSGG